MPFSWRWTKKSGPFRNTESRSGTSGSVGIGPFRFRIRSDGQRGESIRLGRGLRWQRSRKRRW